MPTMNRRRFLELTSATAFAISAPSASGLSWIGQGAPPTAPSQRGWMVYIDSRLGAEGDEYRRRIEAAGGSTPVVGALANQKAALDIKAPTPEQLAYNHVVVVALPDDPLLAQVWQREAAIDLSGRTIYAFGFGHLQGSIGYIESDRNPFLHAAAVVKSPYECEWVSLTGTDRAGVKLAVDAFLKHGLVNGLVAAPGWKRGKPSLLDRDPLPPDFAPPPDLPATLGPLHLIALTQTSEDEYRGVLNDAGVMPRSIWQAKYYAPGQWDTAGQIASFHHYVTGLHRRAYGNTVWAAAFASSDQATSAASGIATAAKLKHVGGSNWTGDLPPYAWAIESMGDGPTTGSLDLRVQGGSVFMLAQTRLV